MANQTVTKRELYERVARQAGCTQVLAKQIIQAFLDEVTDEVARGNRMELRNFGVFDTRLQAPRRARNPRTDEVVHVPAKAVVTFKVGKKLSGRAQEALRHLR